MVYFLAAGIGVAAALLLLPDELPAETSGDSLEASTDVASGGEPEEGKPEAISEARRERRRGRPHGTGGNPKARELQDALDTPAHGLLANTSPIWVQIQRVLREQAEEEWLPEVEALLLEFRDARREMALEAEALIERQSSLLESIWNADLPEALSSALKEPLTILSERLQSFEN